MNAQHQLLALQAQRQEYFNHFNAWPTRKVTTALMIANNVAGSVAKQYKVFPEKSQGLCVLRRGFNWLKSLSRCGLAQATFALTGTATMARKYWEGLVSTHRATLRAISSELEELGLFKIVTPGYQAGYNSHTKKHKCREYHQVCLASLLVAHEQLEEVLTHRGVDIIPPKPHDDSGELDAPNDLTNKWLSEIPQDAPKFPAHCAQWGRVLFNALFEGVAQYRRGESPCVSIEETDSFQQAWGVYGLDEQELEAQAEAIPDNRDLGAAFQDVVDQLGAGVLALVERVLGAHPEWELWLDGDEVRWLPF